ncbi:SET domain [Dillenia turbinata]|uniref:SET domain n=1 Tax=Dillenia turbinata TaxID=194707 RepID=A0AAN8Z189_9MAGN
MSTGDAGTKLVKLTEIQGRGRALVASQSLTAGQVLLRDSPLLLYSALPLLHHHSHHYCSNCFRTLSSSSSSIVSCSSCSSHALFCNPSCLSLSLSSSHSSWVCQSLSRLRNPPFLTRLENRHELQIQAQFLISAYNLAVINPSNFQILLSLQGQPTDLGSDSDSLSLLHSLIESLSPPQSNFGVSLQLTAALLAKDKINAFGLMEPLNSKAERSVRAYGIYPMASFFNHDCLPNACRFDYVDALDRDYPGNVEIIVRVLHDVEQGREICLSYFPVNLKYSERQKRLLDDYGFVCACDRCKVESNWSDEEDEVMDEDDGGDSLDDDYDDDLMVGSGNENENDNGVEGDFPHAYFFLKFMCQRENCWGTLAPLPPSEGVTSTIMECNVCGNLKKGDEIDGDAVAGSFGMDN